MALYRITTSEIKAIKVEDKKTWPVDLDVWVNLSAYRQDKEWDPPFYLSAEQVKMFKAVSAALAKKAAELRAARNKKVRHR